MINGGGGRSHILPGTGNYSGVCIYFSNNVSADFSSVVWGKSGLITSKGDQLRGHFRGK